MTSERIVKKIPLTQCLDTDYYFKKHTGIDLKEIPEQYGDLVTKTMNLLQHNLSLSLVYQCFPIAAIEEEGVSLTTGHRFTGKMAPRILKEAKEVICCVVTLEGFQQLRDTITDTMEDYFADTWGTVYTEGGEAWLRNHITQQLSNSGFRRTHGWNPGQHQFELTNQRPLFDLLKPDDIGCTLDHHLRMIPFKSTSGIFGIVPENLPESEDLLPCDFCHLRKTCPASKSTLSS